MREEGQRIMMTRPTKDVIIYCDGACSGNPGPGGWGAILMYKGHEKRISGYSPNTTNNRMELMAALMALNALKERCNVEVYSDSAYLCNAFNKAWISTWCRNDWKNSKKQTVENKDLWLQIYNKTKDHNVKWIKVKGHADNEYNNLCDEMARAEITKNR